MSDSQSVVIVRNLPDCLAYLSMSRNEDFVARPVYMCDVHTVHAEYRAHRDAESAATLTRILATPITPEAAVRRIAKLAERRHRCACGGAVEFAARSSGPVVVCRPCDASFSYRVGTPFAGSPLDPVRAVQLMSAVLQGATHVCIAQRLDVPLRTVKRIASKIKPLPVAQPG